MVKSLASDIALIKTSPLTIYCDGDLVAVRLLILVEKFKLWFGSQHRSTLFDRTISENLQHEDMCLE